jgi:putative aminopeptidase FrvX
MPEIPETLQKLLSTPGPSGYEARAAAVWREAASFAEITTDKLGSSIATVTGSAEDTLVAVVGHIDEIGLAITHVDEKGFAYFTTVGGWDPQILVGQRVSVDTKDGPVPGVIGRKPIHLLRDEQRKKVVEIEGLHIDVGAADRDEALGMLRIGDSVVIDAQPLPLAGNRLASRSMDNRLGSYVALEFARRCHERGGHAASVAGVAAVQEEIGINGAQTSAYLLRPTIAIVVDVTHATDAPGVDEKENGSHPLGSGPVIGRGATLAPKVFELLVETAEREQMEYSIETSGRRTATDADGYQISRAGIPTGLVSIPLRYMHSPVELVDLGDVEATIELLVAFATGLDPDVDLSR